MKQPPTSTRIKPRDEETNDVEEVKEVGIKRRVGGKTPMKTPPRKPPMKRPPEPEAEAEEEDEKDDCAADYADIVARFQSYFDEHPNAQLGQRFWTDQLNPEERKIVMKNKEDFVHRFRARAQYLTTEWLEDRYQKRSETTINHRQQLRLSNKLRDSLAQLAENKIEEGIIKREFDRISPKASERPRITTDLKAIVYWDKQIVPLESIPPETLQHLIGFDNLSQFERELLMQTLIDKRDGTRTVEAILKSEGIEYDTEKLFKKFKDGGNMKGYNIKARTVYGARPLTNGPDQTPFD
jgi:hypothetical protein